jgi:hypothetical protein
MSMIDITSLVAPTVTQAVMQQPRAVSDTAAQQFREALAKPECHGAACAAPTSDRNLALSALDLDIEKAVMSSLPSLSGSPAEVAVGLLRAQIKVTNISVVVSMAASTTQSLTQNVKELQRG